MSPLLAGLALAAGAAIGLSLGALGGGGSILAVPVLVYLLDQSPAQATTGSLVVVGVTSLTAAVAAHRVGHVRLGRGIAFGTVGLGGAVLGATASSLVPEPVLMAAFAAVLLLAATVMTIRQVRSGRRSDDQEPRRRHRLDDPMITFSPTFACNCPRALKILATATVVGALTGFLGVGGGFLVVPALVLGLGMDMADAAGTSLVVITMTAGAALLVRAGTGTHPDWGLVALLTGAAVAGATLGTRLAVCAGSATLERSFAAVLVAVAGYTAWQAIPAVN
jgi:hypothetical protein